MVVERWVQKIDSTCIFFFTRRFYHQAYSYWPLSYALNSIICFIVLTPPSRNDNVELFASLLEDAVKTTPDVDRIVIIIGTLAIEYAAIPEHLD